MNKLLVSASVALGATSLSFAQQTEKPNFPAPHPRETPKRHLGNTRNNLPETQHQTVHTAP